MDEERQKPWRIPRGDRLTRTKARSGAEPTVEPRVQEVLAALERLRTKKDFENLAKFGITTDKAFGVSVAKLQALAKQLGRSHELAAALWETGWYEARMLTAFIDEPERVTPSQMDQWCRDFDNWAICDTLCMHLWDRTPHAWRKVTQWSRRKAEYEKRAAFALLASLAGHDKAAGDEPFLQMLPLIEAAATDERNFVKKAVSWALRRMGRRSAVLHAAALELAHRLADSTDRTSRWIGKDAIRDLTKPAVLRQIAKLRTALN